MHYAIYVPPCHDYADARTLASLARDAEQAGWEGFFLWDHVVMDWPDPVVDTWVALTAIAMSTAHIRLGPMVTPIARRQPWKLARETVSLDRLSGGRLTLGVGLGSYTRENLNEPRNSIVRAEMLDEGLDVLTGLWRGESFTYEGRHFSVDGATFLPGPMQTPRIPIWCAGRWPNKVPFRRAARYDGIFPLGMSDSGELTPEDFHDVITYVRQFRLHDEPFDVACVGGTPGDDLARGGERIAAFAKAGVTWWLESIDPWRFGWPNDNEGDWSSPWPVDAMRERVLQGPPRV